MDAKNIFARSHSEHCWRCLKYVLNNDGSKCWQHNIRWYLSMSGGSWLSDICAHQRSNFISILCYMSPWTAIPFCFFANIIWHRHAHQNAAAIVQIATRWNCYHCYQKAQVCCKNITNLRTKSEVCLFGP